MPLPAKPLPTQAELLSLFKYEIETGTLFWLPRPETSKANKSFNGRFAHRSAGTLGKHGYLVVEIYSKPYKVHRVIWKMMTGNDPKEWIDHADQDRANNKWENLREATQPETSYNGKMSPRNTSGFRCVSFINRFQKFRVAVQIDGKKTHLGYFSSVEEAHKVAADAITKTRAEFART